MKSVILCEGMDDVWFIGYLLHKWSRSEPKWSFSPAGKISDFYSFPKTSKDEKLEIYQRSEDKLAIWGVGGKDRFGEALRDIYKINTQHPEDRLENIVVVSDRDNNEIAETLSRFEEQFRGLGWLIELKNNSRSNFSYTVEDENYDVYVSPIIIPFDENGALETILMNALSNDDDEDSYVVTQAKQYVSTVFNSGKAPRYLTHARERLKAEFSSVVSIVNPNRSTALFDDLFMLHDW
jgi:hypothetical protein